MRQCQRLIRILNQEFLRHLFHLLYHKNKQIPHIKKIVADISAKYGDYAGEVKGVPMYTFPDVKEVSQSRSRGFEGIKDRL